MNKRSAFRNSHHHSVPIKPIVNTREAPPRIKQLDKGVQLMCPFCPVPHPIVPGQETSCGTVLKVTAVQTTIPQRTVHDKGLECVKCHVVGKGVMVRYGNGFIHLEDCLPGTTLVPPEAVQFSKWAERVYKMKPVWLKKWLEERYGHSQEVRDVNNDGKILGYTFQKV